VLSGIGDAVEEVVVVVTAFFFINFKKDCKINKNIFWFGIKNFEENKFMIGIKLIFSPILIILWSKYVLSTQSLSQTID